MHSPFPAKVIIGKSITGVLILASLSWAACTCRAQEDPASADPAATASPTPPGQTATPAPRTAESAVTPTLPRMGKFDRHAQFLYRIKEGRIGLLFVGDSITDFWPRAGEWSWSKFAPYFPANFGVSGQRTEEVLWRLTNGELDGISPKVVVLLIGTNNVGTVRREKPQWAAAGVAKIVQTIHAKLPQTKLLLLAVFPRGKKDDAIREKVAGINAVISRLDDGRTTRYLDLGHLFLDTQGEIPTDLMSDGLHPTAKGYDLWYEAMKPTLDEMMK